MKCLVLGGRGFIGSHLVKALLTQNHFVRCLDRPRIIDLGNPNYYHPNFESFEGDLISETDIIKALDGCDVCFHLISTTLPKSSNEDPVFDIESNLLGTLRLLKHGVKLGLKKVIFTSSGGTVYGVPQHLPIPEGHPTNPTCSYGISKLAIEKYLGLFNKLYGLDYTVLRLANPYGEGQRTKSSQGVVAVFMGKLLRGEPVDIWGDGTIIRDYIYISDVVNALLAALDIRSSEHIFNIGAGKGLSLNQLLNSIERVTGLTANRCYLPVRGFDVPESILSISHAEKYLGWTPRVGLDEGLKCFFDWLKINNNFKN